MPFIFDNAKPEQSKDTAQMAKGREPNEWLDLVRLAANIPQLASTDQDAISLHPGIGNIRSMEVPGKNWAKPKDYHGLPFGYHMTAYAQGEGAQAVILEFMYNVSGRDRKPSVTTAVREVLSKPDHELSSSEIKSIGPALADTNQSPPESGDYPDPNAYFQIKFARTKTIDGKRVLLIGGRNPGVGKDGNETDDEITAYIDADPKRPGWLPENITYAWKANGDPAVFNQHVQAAMKSFESMKFSNL